MVNSFEDARAGGATLADAAQRLGLTLHHVDAVDAAGLDAKGQRAGIPADAQFLAQAFTAETGDEGDLFEGTDKTTSYAVKVIGATPPKVKPLDEVRTAIKTAWMKERREALLKQKVAEWSDQSKSARDLSGIAKNTGKKVMTAEGQTRRMPAKPFTADLSHALFSQPPGPVVSGPGADTGTYVIARATNVTHPAPDPKNPDFSSYGQILETQLTADVGATLATALKQSQGVTINEAARARTIGEAP